MGAGDLSLVPDADPGCVDCTWPSLERAITRLPANAADEVYIVRDSTTERALPLVVRFPTGQAGPAPVVLWSHGGGFADDGHTASTEWGEAIAAHGFVVIHVAHVTLTDDSRRALCRFAAVDAGECVPGELSFGTIARPRDLIAVLDDLAQVEAWVGERGGPAFDAGRVAIAGHSAGSQGGLVLGGAVRTLSATVTRYRDADPRVIATIGMSPQGPGHNGFFAEEDETSWDDVTLPALLITGVSDINRGNPDSPDGENRRLAFQHLPGGGQYLLYAHTTAGAHDTYNLGDIDAQNPELQSLNEAMTSTVRAFLDARLRDDGQAEAWLASDAPRILAGDAEWLTK